MLKRMTAPDGSTSNELTPEVVRKVARLARLAVDETRLESYRQQLGSVLAHINMLRELDLADVEPMAHASDGVNRWDADEPRAGLPNEVLMRLAPDRAPPFVKVPKVLGEGSGA